MRSKQHTMAMKTNKKGNREKVLFFCFFNTKQQRWHTTTPNERSAADWSKLGSSVSFRQRERELYQRRRGRAYAVPLLLPAAVSIRARWRSGSFFPLCFQSGGRREGRNTWGQRTVEETRGQQFLSICISRFFFFVFLEMFLGEKENQIKQQSIAFEIICLSLLVIPIEFLRVRNAITYRAFNQLNGGGGEGPSKTEYWRHSKSIGDTLGRFENTFTDGRRPSALKNEIKFKKNPKKIEKRKTDSQCFLLIFLSRRTEERKDK